MRVNRTSQYKRKQRTKARSKQDFNGGRASEKVVSERDQVLLYTFEDDSIDMSS